MAYKDIKFSTMIEKLNKYIQESIPMNLKRCDYIECIERIATEFFKKENYPFYIKFIEQFNVYLIDTNICIAELTTRTKRDRKNKTQSSVRFLKTGAYFNLKVSELINRRQSGITCNLDYLEKEAAKIGYSSIVDFYEDIENVKAKLEQLQDIIRAFNWLSESEKECIKKQSNERELYRLRRIQ